jgi:hypothetical protein
MVIYDDGEIITWSSCMERSEMKISAIRQFHVRNYPRFIYLNKYLYNLNKWGSGCMKSRMEQQFYIWIIIEKNNNKSVLKL